MGNDLARGPSLQTMQTDVNQSQKYGKSFKLLNNIFQFKKYKDLDEHKESFNVSLEEIKATLIPISYKKKPSSEDKNGLNDTWYIKVNELKYVMPKLEEIIGYDLQPFEEFLLTKYSLSRTKYGLTFNDFQTAFINHLDYVNKRSQIPSEDQEYEENSNKKDMNAEKIAKKRQQGFFHAYTARNQDPKEQQRIKSLQLICFKIANHKQEILNLLKKYVEYNELTRQSSDLTDDDVQDPVILNTPNKGNLLSIPMYVSQYTRIENKGMIPLSKLIPLLHEFSNLIKVVLVSFEQYIKGYTPDVNDMDCVAKFEKFFYLGLSQESCKFIKKISVLRPLETSNRRTIKASLSQRVRFVEEGLEYAKKEGQIGFSPEYFMLKIDKFFAQESSVVPIETNNEYLDYLERQRKEKEDQEKTFNELDDFFFNDSLDRNISTDTRMLTKTLTQTTAAHQQQNNNQNPEGNYHVNKARDNITKVILMQSSLKLAKKPTLKNDNQNTMIIQNHESGYINQNASIKIGVNQQQAIMTQDQSDVFKNLLVNTMKNFEDVLKNYGHNISQLQKQEVEKLIQIMQRRLQVYEMMKNGSERLESIEDSMADEDLLENLRKKGLQEIFYFYTHQIQRSIQGHQTNKKPMIELTLGDYARFCYEFNVPVSNQRIQDIFIKSSNNNKTLSFPQFFESLNQLAQEFNQARIDENTSQIKKLNIRIKNHLDGQKIEDFKQSVSINTINEQDPKVKGRDMSNEDPDHSQQQIVVFQSQLNMNKNNTKPHIQLLNPMVKSNTITEVDLSSLNFQKDTLLNSQRILEQKTQDQQLQDFLTYLECHDPSKYRLKMKTQIAHQNSLDNKPYRLVQSGFANQSTTAPAVKNQKRFIISHSVKQSQATLQNRLQDKSITRERDSLERTNQAIVNQIKSPKNNFSKDIQSKVKQIRNKTPSRSRGSNQTFLRIEQMHFSDVNHALMSTGIMRTNNLGVNDISSVNGFNRDQFDQSANSIDSQRGKNQKFLWPDSDLRNFNLKQNQKQGTQIDFLKTQLMSEGSSKELNKSSNQSSQRTNQIQGNQFSQKMTADQKINYSVITNKLSQNSPPKGHQNDWNSLRDQSKGLRTITQQSQLESSSIIKARQIYQDKQVKGILQSQPEQPHLKPKFKSPSPSRPSQQSAQFQFHQNNQRKDHSRLKINQIMAHNQAHSKKSRVREWEQESIANVNQSLDRLTNIFDLKIGTFDSTGGRAPSTTKHRANQSLIISSNNKEQSNIAIDAVYKPMIGMNNSIQINGNVNIINQGNSLNRNQIINRAQQLNQQAQIKEQRNLNNIMRMHDQNMKRGFFTVKKFN